MGKVLTGELSCPVTGLVASFLTGVNYSGKDFAPVGANSFKSGPLLGGFYVKGNNQGPVAQSIVS